MAYPYPSAPYPQQPMYPSPGGPLTWIPMYAGQMIPPGAEPAGRDQDGAPLYAGRARHDGDLIPAKVKPYSGAYVAWGGEEHHKSQFEVLVSQGVAWKFARDGVVPHNAVPVGNTSTGEPLFMGRAYHEGSTTPGKIQRSHGCLYISFGGREIPCKEYEVLIMA